MAEILYKYTEKQIRSALADIRWLDENELDLFNLHLSLCGQKELGGDQWKRIYADGTVYCLLFENGIPVARACVEKYSKEAWEVADVRVVKSHRNKGFAYEVSLFVLKYILDNNKNATIRTEEDNYPMQHVISKLGFTTTAVL